MAFEWMQCSFYLKKSLNDSEITMNLTPYHRLQLLTKEEKVEDLEFDVLISFQRNLMWDGSIGWNWHKSWTIPDINVELKATLSENPALDVSNLKNLHAQLYIVKPILSKEYSLCVEDLGLQGNTSFELINNKCTFTGLKFSATSYNNQGSKFHFLLTIYDSSDKKGQSSKILLSRISTPIFVDSRKSAREAELIKLKKLSAYIEPFELSALHKRFIKKESKRSKGYAEEEIENNLGGLYNYFGAANIRNKVKHPLFLASKFSQCFSIYYQPNERSQSNIVKYIQDILLTIYDSIRGGYRSNNRQNGKKLLLVVKTQNLLGKMSIQKRIPQFLQPIITQEIGCFLDTQSIPQGFVRLDITSQVIQLYKSSYSEIVNQCGQIYCQREQQIKNQSEPKIQEKIVNVPPEEKPSEFEFRQTEASPQCQVMDQESVSDDSESNQRPDIPLKCQIIVEPLRHRPLKLREIMLMHQKNRNKKQLVMCQKRLLSDTKELTILNDLMCIQIEKRRKALRQLESRSNSVSSYPN